MRWAALSYATPKGACLQGNVVLTLHAGQALGALTVCKYNRYHQPT